MLELAERFRKQGKTIGFVPTMGALHAGHRSLVERSTQENDVTIVSVFVNPTQFNDENDLKHYPRTFNEDRELLEESGVDLMFHPHVREVYPDDRVDEYDLNGLDENMEGPHRPGHFNGVVQVVMRLFELTLPNRAYFGQKDFQQLTIIRSMSEKLQPSVQVIGCATQREPSGLALSSRNMHLSADGKKTATHLFAVLNYIRRKISDGERPTSARLSALEQLEAIDGLRIEYLELVDPKTLELIQDQSTESIQACVAAYVEGIRLIDNLRVK